MLVRTKIIATLGPSSSTGTVLRKMMNAGMDIARLNFSHGTHEEHLQRINKIRELNRKYHRKIKLLQDLEGYRIRVGKIENKNRAIQLEKKSTVIVSNDEKVAGKNLIPIDYAGPLTDIKTGTHIYIDDGNIALRVKERTRTKLKTEVEVPGIIKENKGVNIPDLKLRFQELTDKDKVDLEFGIANGIDFVAQSFVRSKKDIIKLREHIGGRSACAVIAKIENPDGIRNIDEIIDVADGIMVARGDMGVSLPIYKVPIMQKMIIKKCNRDKKFVITATQMLESMTEHLRPTRAEVSDVTNAILDGTDYVMLSEETAAGAHPVEAVRMMNNIAKYTESILRKLWR